MRRPIKYLLVFVVVLAVGSIASEVAARVWLSSNPDIDVMDFRASRPSAYANSPFFSNDFISQQREFRKKLPIFYGQQLVQTNTFHSSYYTLTNGFRLTSEQPQNSEHTVWMLGNSTLIGSEVPDSFTIPSQLQALFNIKGINVIVQNLGIDASTIAQEVSYLKTLKVRPGDTIVIYGGYMDSLEIVNLAANTARLRFPGRLCQRLKASLFQSLGLVKVFCKMVDFAPELNNESFVDEKIQNKETQLDNTLIEAEQWSNLQGVNFYFFLQPLLYSMPLSPQEQALPDLRGTMSSQTETVVLRVWPIFERLSYRFPGANLTHLLDPRRSKGESFFLDAVHITESGNSLVAKMIFEQLTIF